MTFHLSKFSRLNARSFTSDAACITLCGCPPFRHAASLMRNSRFRRDVRTLEEEEELWFDQDDDAEDGEGPPPMSDLLKHKLDADLDNIQKIWEHKKGELPSECWNDSSY